MTPGLLLVISILIQFALNDIVNLIIPGFVYSDVYRYIQVPLSTFLSICVPCYLYLSSKGRKITDDFSKDVKPDKLIIVSALIGLCTQFFGSAVNLPIIILLKALGANLNAVIPDANSIGGFILSVFCFALIPAVFEEILFRGIVFNHFRQFGNRAAIIISALLFAIMHLSFQNFAPPFMLGIVFGIMYASTNRLIYSVVSHFILNFTACVISVIPHFPLIENFYNDYFLILLLTSIPGIYYLLKYFKNNCRKFDSVYTDTKALTKEVTYNIDENNSIKVYEHDIRENNIRLAFRNLLMSPYFYIMIIIFLFYGGKSLW